MTISPTLPVALPQSCSSPRPITIAQMQAIQGVFLLDKAKETFSSIFLMTTSQTIPAKKLASWRQEVLSKRTESMEVSIYPARSVTSNTNQTLQKTIRNRWSLASQKWARQPGSRMISFLCLHAMESGTASLPKKEQKRCAISSRKSQPVSQFQLASKNCLNKFALPIFFHQVESVPTIWLASWWNWRNESFE